MTPTHSLHEKTSRPAARSAVTALRERLRSMHPSRRSGTGSESGAVLVEFALVLPIVLLVFLLIVDFGKGFNYWIDETHLASEGARFAAVNRTPNGSDVRDYIRQQADSQELRNGGTRSVPNALQVCIDFPNGAEVGNEVRVQVQSSYRWLPFLGLAVTESAILANATHRIERKPTYAAGCS